MSPADWAGIAVAVTTVVASFAGAVRWLVKHYLTELKPNGGSSVKDQLNRLEREFEIIKDLVMELVKK
jgi:hypothetical protein